MAYIIKSDVAVEDPNGKYPYFTRFGITHPDIKVYMDNLELEGYSMTKQEFDALERFIKTLEERSLWNGILEVYPFIGDSISAATVKLKSLNSSKLLIKNTTTSASLSLDDNWDITADGKIIGIKNARTYQSALASCFDTNITVGELSQEWGFSAYILDTEIVNVEDKSHALFGASLDEFANSQVLVEYRNWNDAGLDGCIVCGSNRTGRGLGSLPLAYVPGGRILQYTCDRSDMMALSGGTKVLETKAPNYTFPKSEDRPVYLLAKSPFTGDVMQGFNGGMRFAMIEKVYGTVEDKSVIKGAIDTLMTDLEKKWS